MLAEELSKIDFDNLSAEQEEALRKLLGLEWRKAIENFLRNPYISKSFFEEVILPTYKPEE